MSKVRLKSSFSEILGNNGDEFAPAERRQRWEQWLSIARAKGHVELAEDWTETGETCEGCIHLDGNWCKLMELPATVNPYLTFRTGMVGMACMGAGKQTADASGQLELFEADSGIPF